MNTHAGRFQDASFFQKYIFLRKISEWLLPSNLQHSLVQHFVLMTSSEFTELLPGSNKVHYPISDRKDVTLVLASVLGRQNHINE